MFRHPTKKKIPLKNFQGDIQYSTDYPHRLNFYSVPPLNEVTLEEFELWAIDRLYGESAKSVSCKRYALTRYATVLGEIESSLHRNKTQKEMEVSLKPLFEKYMPLNSNTVQAARSVQLDYERKKDHYSHFILRLAFCRS
jgi:DNA primase large subunit